MLDGTAIPLWPAAGSLAAGIGTVVLMRYVLDYRDKPGGGWFLGVLAAQALWCLAYGVGLLVFAPAARLIFERLVWVGIVWTGVAFLAFALEYTGRGDVVRAWPFGIVAAVGLLSTGLVLTNPLHHAMWAGFRLDPVFGVATVSYVLQPFAYLVIGVATLSVTIGVVLLVDTLVSYGPLYRREAAAVAVSALPPGFALLAWAGGVGPAPQLNLAPVMFVPHVALDAYAFGRAELFERNPTTSRAAERTVLDDLADPIAVVDRDGQVVRLNDAARSAFVDGDADPLAAPLESVLGVGVALEGDNDTVEHAAGENRRTYSVSVSPLRDPVDTHVGYTVVFTDVTERERRRQQLAVLNRILRHNLRNDAGVVHGYAELLAERLDGEAHRMADAIERRSGALEALGEKAKTVETLIGGEEPTPLAVDALVEHVVSEGREAAPDAEIALEADVGHVAALPKRTLLAAVENLLENAVAHHDGEGTEREDGGPWVAVRTAAENGDVVVEVADDGPGIPEGELAAIEAGRETRLQHGSGIGLWVVHWAAAALGGEATHADREPRGTVATLRFPAGETEPTDAGRSDAESQTSDRDGGEPAADSTGAEPAK